MYAHPEGPEPHRHGPDDEAEIPAGRGFRSPGGHGGAGHGGPRRGGPRGGRGFGRPGGWQQADLPPAEDAAAWFTGRLPSGWFVGATEVSVDREEIIVTGELPPVSTEAADTADSDTTAAVAAGRISRFREETRGERIKIAAEAEARYGRKVAWGARIGDTGVLFTHLSIPVMTRLRQPERQVLDTLVDAGVARSRSEALAWAVKLVGEHTDEWLSSLRQAMSEVDKLRAEGPTL
jgi:hypothetical protein